MDAPTPTPALLPMLLALLPVAAMLAACAWAQRPRTATAGQWRALHRLSEAAWLLTLASAALQGWLAWRSGGAAPAAAAVPGLQVTLVGAIVALLVQGIGTVLAHFSARYLQGEPRQARYVAALAAVLAAVHVLLLADHWVPLIAAWAAVGLALQRLLCFYDDRPFARLAAHKKALADRVADGLLVGAAALAWSTVGSGSFADLQAHLQVHGATPALQASAVLLALAVVLRVALLPVHGWLIQVMEAPTPVSALLHAGVVNLGGYVLIRLWPLLEPVMAARWLLVVMGLATAAGAGLVMLTRVSIKVRLAWSTVAQMGFMVLECAAGLPTLALLHLVGHSLYKSHAFLSSSQAVRDTRLAELQGAARPAAWSLVLAPVAAIAVVLAVALPGDAAPWPWWWSAVLGLAWAPLLWQAAPAVPGGARRGLVVAGFALLLAAAFTAAARLAHALPWGLQDTPAAAPGLAVLAGMAALYALQAVMQWRPQALSRLRRWAYAGFYLDEFHTRATLLLWPGRWVPQRRAARSAAVASTRPAHARF